MTREQASNMVAQDCHDLQALVTRIWSHRLNPATADLVAVEEGNLWASLGVLRELVSDVRETQDSEQREAAE